METLSRKDQTAAELIREVAAQFVQRESNGVSLITITGVRLHPKSSRATVLFTTLPREKEPAVLEFLQRKEREFLEYTRDHARIGRNYIYNFEVDVGEHYRQRIDELTQEK